MNEESLGRNSDSTPRQSEDSSKKTARKRTSSNKQRLIANYDPEQQEKIRRANCLAARECRKRKKILTQNLEATLESVKNENQILQGQYDALAKLASQLKARSTATQNEHHTNVPGSTSSISQSSSASIGTNQMMNQRVHQNVMPQNLGMQQQTPLVHNTPLYQPIFLFQAPSIAQGSPIQAIMPQAIGMGNLDPFVFQQIQNRLHEQASADNAYSSLAQVVGQGQRMNQGQGISQGLDQSYSFTGLPHNQIPMQGMNSIQMPTQDMNQRVPNLINAQFMVGDSFSCNQVTASLNTNHDDDADDDDADEDTDDDTDKKPTPV